MRKRVKYTAAGLKRVQRTRWHEACCGVFVLRFASAGSFAGCLRELFKYMLKRKSDGSD